VCLTPYYRSPAGGVVLYNADCREVLPLLPAGSADAVITDPVWPNSLTCLAGSDRPAALFAEAAAHFPRLLEDAGRLVVQLGCDSDPRFLLGVPAVLPFLRACWLPYAVPSYKGRLLDSGDMAYAFGEWPPSRKGRRVIDGEAPRDTLGQPQKSLSGVRKHPSPRHLPHVRWLVSRFANGPVLDCFAGIGTTLVACQAAGWPCVGIEVEEAFCETAARRLSQGTLPGVFAGVE
jgi:hypothetical protein